MQKMKHYAEQNLNTLKIPIILVPAHITGQVLLILETKNRSILTTTISVICGCYYFCFLRLYLFSAAELKQRIKHLFIICNCECLEFGVPKVPGVLIYCYSILSILNNFRHFKYLSALYVLTCYYYLYFCAHKFMFSLYVK